MTAGSARLDALDPARWRLPDGVAARLLSPALVVHLDVVRENLARVIAAAGGPERWRPHVKTTKLPVVWAEMARAGVRHFKCATTREADELLNALEEEGVTDADLLLAYPLVGPALEVLGRIAGRHPGARVSVLCEDAESVAAVPGNLDVFVDVNPGMHRTGVPAADRETIHAVAAAAGERFAGVHWYDGHLHGPHAERRALAHASYDALLELRAGLEAAGHAVRELVTSGTPTFLHALAHPGLNALATVHRVSPGTVVFHDARSDEENPDLELLPAAVLFTRVVSLPDADVVTCDAGSKSIAAEAGDPCAVVLGHPALVALGPSEEHLPLRVTSGERPARGDTLLLVPRHICPTVNLAEEVLLVDGGQAVGVARVTARAHPVL